MRILMLAPQPFFQPRGTPLSVLHRLKALSQLGYRIDFLTYPLGDDIDIPGVRVIRIPRVPGIRGIAVGPSAEKLPLDWVLFSKASLMLRGNGYDLLHTHEEAGFFGAFVAARYGVLHLYDMHSSLPQQLFNFNFTRSRFLVRLFERLEQRTLARADAVITICPELYRYVAERFPGTYQVLIENVADNGVVFGSNGRGAEVRARYGVNGSRVVVYAGTFEPYQGLDLLIESAPEIVSQGGDVMFVLVGGKPEQVARYRDRVAALGLSDRFVFPGSVAPEEVPAYVEAADVLVSPRVSGTNTPLKIYSYLRSGKPIVATRHVTHTQVLSDEVAVLTECSAEGLGRGIVEVLENGSLARRLAEEARRLAEQRYSYRSYVERTQAVYRYLEGKLEQRRSAT